MRRLSALFSQHVYARRTDGRNYERARRNSIAGVRKQRQAAAPRKMGERYVYRGVSDLLRAFVHRVRNRSHRKELYTRASAHYRYERYDYRVCGQ